MLEASKFINDHPYIVAATFGLPVIGFLGFKAVKWILEKIGLIQKVDQAAAKTFKKSADFPLDIKGKWWTNVTESDEYKSFKRNWNVLSDSNQATEKAAELKKAYQETKADKTEPYFGTVYNVPSNFSFYMKGIAFIASYLQSKKNIQGLFVCRGMQGVHDKIEELHQNPADQKMALIVGDSEKIPSYPQHKVAILLEKKAGIITIALLDPMPEGHNRDIEPDNILSSNEHIMGYSLYNSKERVFRQIYRTCMKSGIEARFLDSIVRRETHGGCAIFALQDAVAFLRDPSFFEKVHVSKEVRIEKNFKIEHIDTLPVECLIGTQSISIMQSHKVKGINFDSTLIARKKTGNQYLADHKIVVNNKAQNHYITKKFFNYMKFIIQSLETMDEEDVNHIANRCLI